MSAEAFRAALADLAMTQTVVATKLGVTLRQANRWATGAAPVPTSVSLLLAAWLTHSDLIP